MDEDFRAGARSRRQTWRGSKKVVKRLVALPGLNQLARRAVPRVLPGADTSRLPVPVHVRRVTARMAGVEFTMLDPARCVVAKELHWGGGRRPRPEDQLALDVFAALARGADLLVDVGAYTGVFSLLGARVEPRAQVHAFEIIPSNAAAAVRNAVANDLLRQVEVHTAGVGTEGTDLVVPSGEGGSALPDYFSADMSFSSGVRVPLRSLDALAPGWGRPGPTVVKIDVEGSENDVLRGAAEFVAARRPDVLCEVLPGQDDVTGLLDVLAPHGYRWLVVTDERLVEHPAPFGHPRWRDWLLTPRTDDDLRARGIPVAAA